MNFFSIYMNFISCISFFSDVFSIISSHGKPVWSFVYLIIYCVDAAITFRYQFLADWKRTFSVERWKRRGPRRTIWTERCLFPTSFSIFFIDNMIKVLFSICTLNWPVNNYVSRQGKGINRRNESTIIII